MTEASGAIDAGEMRARLSDEWRVETDGRGVYGYADRRASATSPGANGVPACFSIRHDDELWAATWKSPHELDEDVRAVSERVTGARERCVEWVVEKAQGLEEDTDE